MDRRMSVKQFPPEMAGERVGWVSVQEPEGRNDIVSVGLAIATVGEDGAQYGYDIVNTNHEQHRVPNDEGFLAVSSLFMIIDKKGRTDPSSQFYFSSRLDGGKAESILHTAGGYGGLTPRDDVKQWRYGAPALLDALKEGLQLKELSDSYADVYYAINMGIGADKNMGANVIDRAYLMMPDPKMAETTSNELVGSLRIANLIKNVIDIDELMTRELTVFSNLQAKQVPEVFANTRRMVAAKETEVREIACGLRSRLGVYKPIGYRPNGRTWPYMDPEEPDEEKSYGFVLQDLKNRRVGIANYELEREVSEARKRLDYAMNGVGLLGALSVSERETAQVTIGGC